jgi:DNA-binding transcriptional LysR family regulator
MVLLPSGDPLSKRKEVAWSALANGKYIAINRSRSSVHHLAGKALSENGHTAEPSFEVGSMTSAVAFVQCGMGYTIVPKIALTMLRVDNLEARRLRAPIVNRDIAMLWYNKRSLSPAAMALRDELANYCNRE